MATALLAAGAAFPPPGAAGPPLPHAEVVDTIRDLAAARMGRKPAEIDTIQPLVAQGLRENDFQELVSEIESEFGVMIPANEVHAAKWNDPVVGLSIRRLADLVSRRMREPPGSAPF